MKYLNQRFQRGVAEAVDTCPGPNCVYSADSNGGVLGETLESYTTTDPDEFINAGIYYFLGYILEDDNETIKEIYACTAGEVNSDNILCLRGVVDSDSSIHAENVRRLNEYYPGCNTVASDYNPSVCTGDFTKASADSPGDVGVSANGEQIGCEISVGAGLCYY